MSYNFSFLPHEFSIEQMKFSSASSILSNILFIIIYLLSFME